MSHSDADDERWFEARVLAELPFLLGYARRRVGDPDDVVAEVLALAWRHRAALRARPPEQMRPWLLRTASHQILHVYRSSHRRERLADRLIQHRAGTPAEDHADATGSRVDAARLVTAAMARLSPTDQEILRLHAWEQLELADIAFVLVCRPVTAKVRLHRARKRLAAAVLALSAHPEPEPEPEPEPAPRAAPTRRPADAHRPSEVTS